MLLQRDKFQEWCQNLGTMKILVNKSSNAHQRARTILDIQSDHFNRDFNEFTN